jgi:cysteine dioxygenase
MIPPALQDLCGYLDRCRGPVDLAHLHKLLDDQPLSRAELCDFCHFGDATYRRNSVIKSHWYEIFCICWRPGQKSYIHDHHGSSCAFKIIEGHATEIICLPTGGRRDGQPLVRPVNVVRYGPGAICTSGSSQIHEVVNESTSDDLITLHIYSPPLAMRIYAYEDPSAPYHSTPEREAAACFA